MSGWVEPAAGAPEAFVEALLRFLDAEGQAWYDEDVTQLAHALQAGALARAAGAPDALVVAALLHDVGHLLAGPHAPDRDLEHEAVGARFLGRWFGPDVAGPVALHVRAKRYLVGRDPAYATTLSAASTRSLALQGGPLAGEAIEAFRRLPHAEAAILVRRWDDQAKVPGLAVPPLATFAPLLVRTARPAR